MASWGWVAPPPSPLSPRALQALVGTFPITEEAPSVELFHATRDVTRDLMPLDTGARGALDRLEGSNLGVFLEEDMRVQERTKGGLGIILRAIFDKIVHVALPIIGETPARVCP